MRRTVLYYPSIEIPDGKWLRNALLYWDEVSSIVPRSVEEALYKNSRTINELKEEGEYRAIYPDQIMNNKLFEDFEKESIYKMRSYFRKIDKSRNTIEPARRHTQIHKEKLINNYDLHKEKISNNLMTFLEQNGVISLDGEWLTFDNKLSDIYMSILAKYSALSDVNHTVIGTDQLRPINTIYPIRYLSKLPIKFKVPIINFSLNALPTPHLEVPISKILKFKRRYRDELLSFRNHINHFEEEMSHCEYEDEFKEKTLIFSEAIEQKTRDTIRMMKGSGIKFVLSSLQSLINIKSPTMIATYAAVAGQKIIGLNPTLAITGIGLTSIVDISINYMGINKATRDQLSDKGFLYLYYANKRGIIKDFV